MVLLQRAGYRQTKLLGKITKDNLGLKRLGLTEKKDLEGIKKKTGPEQKAKKEIKEETGPEQEAKGEKRIER